MPHFSKTDLVLDHQFSLDTCRHMINGWCSVLHCHHYATLYSQLADDVGFMDAKKLLIESAEDSFFDMLISYFNLHHITDLAQRIAIGEQYYAAVGLGRLEVMFVGSDSGAARLHTSHVDEGWKRKWGMRDKPVNFITSGYLAALFAAALNRQPRAFKVIEVQSIVSGADHSLFNATAI